MSFLVENETTVRIVVFSGVLCALVILEIFLPRKKRILPRHDRWITNLSLVVIDTVALRLLVPVAAIGVAGIAAEKGWGLFNLLDWPFWLECSLAIIILDCLIYWQHVLSHSIPALWAIHRVHHADRDFDVTTAVRFHPVEIVLSMLYKMLGVLVLGPQVIAVVIFEVLLNACAMFNHANLVLPLPVDKILRRVLVTPDMHRVHHSVVPRETNSNYGFSFSVWDFVFSTYIAQPAAGHDEMVIGIATEQTDRPASLIWSLMWPFRTLKTYVQSLKGFT